MTVTSSGRASRLGWKSMLGESLDPQMSRGTRAGELPWDPQSSVKEVRSHFQRGSDLPIHVSPRFWLRQAGIVAPTSWADRLQ